jgi:hypothetical protein
MKNIDFYEFCEYFNDISYSIDLSKTKQELIKIKEWKIKSMYRILVLK